MGVGKELGSSWVGIGQDRGSTEHFQLHDFGDIIDDGVDLVERCGRIDIYIMLIIIHEDGVSIGGSSKQLIFSNQKCIFLQLRHQQRTVFLLLNIIRC